MLEQTSTSSIFERGETSQADQQWIAELERSQVQFINGKHWMRQYPSLRLVQRQL